MKSHPLYNIWNKVPVDYYQKGVRRNFLQWIWHNSKINLAKRIIKDLDYQNCLDIGCASGFMLSKIAEFKKASYVGVDIYDKAINYAKKRYPHISFKKASASKLPFKDNSFDLILCYETIEHVEDPQSCLKEAKRVLRKNGIFILTMDSGSLLFRIVWWFWENSKGQVWQGAHLHPFHHNELEELIKKAGFSVQDKIFSFLDMEVTFVLKK